MTDMPHLTPVKRMTRWPPNMCWACWTCPNGPRPRRGSAHDPGFAALVADWEQRLGGPERRLCRGPCPDLLPQIEARLFPKLPQAGWFRSLWAWRCGCRGRLASWPISP